MEIVKANKFHKDTGIQFSDYSEKSISLSNKFNEQKFFPKSECKVFPLKNGEVQINIPEWLFAKPDVQHFFRKS